jgi:hypothetical protein
MRFCAMRSRYGYAIEMEISDDGYPVGPEFPPYSRPLYAEFKRPAEFVLLGLLPLLLELYPRTATESDVPGLTISGVWDP